MVLTSKMYFKTVSAETVDLEIELQTIASHYGFCPRIETRRDTDDGCIIGMEDVESACLADIYGDDPSEIPNWIWDKIRAMVTTLFEEEGIEYVDITPYNFIQKDNRIYMIDFGDAKYTTGDTDWFLDEFINGENSWNPDYK